MADEPSATATDAPAQQGGTDVVQANDNTPAPFSPEQQQQLDKLFAETRRSAEVKAAKKYEQEIADLRAKLDKATAKPAAKGDTKTKLSDDDWEQKFSEVREQHDQTVQELKQKLQGIERDKIRTAIIDAAASSECTNPGQLASLLTADGYVSMDDDNNIVIDPKETGISRIGDDGKPISPATFVKRFIATNPHWQRYTGQGGTGSRDGAAKGDRSLLNMTPEQIRALSKEDYAELRTKLRKPNTGYIQSYD